MTIGVTGGCSVAHSVVSVGSRVPQRVSDARQAVEGIVGIGGGVAVSIGHRDAIAVNVVGVVHRAACRVGDGEELVAGVVSIGRRVAIGVGD